MGLLPEFFMLLGIDVFLAMSLLSALLDDDLPSPLQYLFQGAALLGLGQLFLSQGFINSGVYGREPTDPTRFWISAIYLAAAVSNVLGLNIYLAVVRRKMTLASTFSGTVTVPTMMTSMFFVSSFIGSAGEVSLTSATAMMLAVSALVSGLSIFGFLRQAARRTEERPSIPARPSPPSPPSPPVPTARGSRATTQSVSKSSSPPSVVLPFGPSRQWEEWEDAESKKRRGGEN